MRMHTYVHKQACTDARPRNLGARASAQTREHTNTTARSTARPRAQALAHLAPASADTHFERDSLQRLLFGTVGHHPT